MGSITNGRFNYGYENISKFKDGKFQDASFKRQAWEQDDGLDDLKDGNGLKKEAWHDLATQFDKIDNAGDGSKKDDLISVNDLWGAVKDNKITGDARRAAILLMTNKDLLNQLDDGDKDGLISKSSLASKDSITQDDNKKKFNDALGCIGNDPSVDFMDKYESIVGKGNGSNGLIGALGISGLASLADHKDIFDKFKAGDTSGSDKAVDEWLKGYGDDVNKGQLRELVNDLRKTGDKNSGPAFWADNAKTVYADQDNLKKFLDDHHGAPGAEDLRKGL